MIIIGTSIEAGSRNVLYNFETSRQFDALPAEMYEEYVDAKAYLKGVRDDLDFATG